MKLFYENRNCVMQSFEAVDLEFPEHIHDHAEILSILQGSITVQIMGQRQELKEGDCAVVFPQEIHSYHDPRNSRSRLFIFEDTLAGMYFHSMRKCRPSSPFLTAEKMSGDGALALERLYELSGGGERAKRDWAVGRAAAIGRDPADVDKLCSAWVQVLFAWIWPHLAPVKREQSESMELTCRLVQYVMEHFQEPLTLETLARELHVNKYYVSNIFSGVLQTNFRGYLNHIRLEYAMQLMQASSAPLTDIWAEAGFNSQRSFNRAFMEIMGMTPMEYRKKLAG